jgi:hypothetical protein
MLSLSALRDYNEWVGRTALEIRLAAIAYRGWANVFPKGSETFPMWASRVRNYFNEKPRKLKLLHLKEAGKAWIASGYRGATFGLSGDVYEDGEGRHWFEMSTAGVGYHYEGEVSDAAWYKTWESAVSLQKHTPLFKLISPDGTGGSLEVCIHNWQHHEGASTIGQRGEWMDVRDRVVLNEILKGSYNYSETTVVGFGAHKYRDIDSHSKETGFYLDPRYSQSQMHRVFPRNDPRGRSIDLSDMMIKLKH